MSIKKSVKPICKCPVFRFGFYAMEVGRHTIIFCFRSLKEDLEKRAENQDNVRKKDSRGRGGRYFSGFLSPSYEERRFPKCGVKVEEEIWQ